MPDEKVIIEYRPICQVCAHFTLGSCAAYPRGIPGKIWKRGGHHRKVEADQEGTDTLLFTFAEDRDFVVEIKLMTVDQAKGVRVTAEAPAST